MEMLYEKQDNVYNKTGIQNYIFFVDNIDENEVFMEMPPSFWNFDGGISLI